MTETPPRANTSVLIEGLEAARSRFAASTAGTSSSFHSAFEMLAWACAVIDRSDQEDRALPPAVNGLWCVRNVMLHYGADVLDWILVPGTAYGEGAYGAGVYGGGAYQAWTWRNRAEMPEPRSKRGAPQYDAHLAGEDAIKVFDELLEAIS